MGASPVQGYTTGVFHLSEGFSVTVDARGPMTVLLVDDSEEFLNAASSWIATQSALRLVGTARNGEEALSFLDRSGVSLVLMDCFMPILDGFEATRRIKSSGGAPLVIMLSVHEGSAMEHEAWAAGADGFVAKSDFAGRLPEIVQSLREGDRAPHRGRPATLAPEESAEREREEPGFLRLALDGFSARLRNVGKHRPPRVGKFRSLTEGGKA